MDFVALVVFDSLYASTTNQGYLLIWFTMWHYRYRIGC